MTLRLIELREWATSSGIRLSPEEVQRLREVGAGLKVLATGTPGAFDVEASSVVGTVVGSAFRAVIRPKLPMRHVLFLLGFLDELPEFEESFFFGEEQDLLEIMLELYLHALERALARGLVRGYREREEAIGALRGRLDATKLITRRFGLFPPLDCRFSEFTADTEANRRLLAAARLLLRGGPVANPRVRGSGVRRVASMRSRSASARSSPFGIPPPSFLP